jgi:hypothetical protein
VRGQSAFDVAEQIEEGTWMIPTSSQSHVILRRLGEIERKLDDMEELRTTTATRRRWQPVLGPWPVS